MTIELIYWDSDAFLGWLQAEPDKVDLCRGTLDRAKSGEVVIVTSALTVTEVLWMRGAPRIPQDKSDILRKFFRRSHFRVRNVTRKTAEAAQDFVWHNGVAPKDAIHVATALEAGAPTLETFDEKLIGKTGLIGAPPLIIRKPIPPREPDMFR